MFYIASNSSFDAKYYMGRYSDVREKVRELERANSTISAEVYSYVHYILYGANELRNPNPWFNTYYYLKANHDVRSLFEQDSIVFNPLTHYDNYGWREGRNPSSLFNTNFYLTNSLYSNTETISLLQHYKNIGLLKGCIPTEDYDHFNYHNYLKNYPDVQQILLPNLLSVDQNTKFTNEQKSTILSHWFYYGIDEKRIAELKNNSIGIASIIDNDRQNKNNDALFSGVSLYTPSGAPPPLIYKDDENYTLDMSSSKNNNTKYLTIEKNGKDIYTNIAYTTDIIFSSIKNQHKVFKYSEHYQSSSINIDFNYSTNISITLITSKIYDINIKLKNLSDNFITIKNNINANKFSTIQISNTTIFISGSLSFSFTNESKECSTFTINALDQSAPLTLKETIDSSFIYIGGKSKFNFFSIATNHNGIHKFQWGTPMSTPIMPAGSLGIALNSGFINTTGFISDDMSTPKDTIFLIQQQLLGELATKMDRQEIFIDGKATTLNSLGNSWLYTQYASTSYIDIINNGNYNLSGAAVGSGNAAIVCLNNPTSPLTKWDIYFTDDNTRFGKKHAILIGTWTNTVTPRLNSEWKTPHVLNKTNFQLQTYATSINLSFNGTFIRITNLPSYCQTINLNLSTILNFDNPGFIYINPDSYGHTLVLTTDNYSGGSYGYILNSNTLSVSGVQTIIAKEATPRHVDFSIFKNNDLLYAIINSQFDTSFINISKSVIIGVSGVKALGVSNLFSFKTAPYNNTVSVVINGNNGTSIKIITPDKSDLKTLEIIAVGNEYGSCIIDNPIIISALSANMSAATDLQKIVISGDQDISLADSSGTSDFTIIDASKMTGSFYFFEFNDHSFLYIGGAGDAFINYPFCYNHNNTIHYKWSLPEALSTTITGSLSIVKQLGTINIVDRHQRSTKNPIVLEFSQAIFGIKENTISFISDTASTLDYLGDAWFYVQISSNNATAISLSENTHYNLSGSKSAGHSAIVILNNPKYQTTKCDIYFTDDNTQFGPDHMALIGTMTTNTAENTPWLNVNNFYLIE